MNQELALKLQAYVDGELSPREARWVEDRLESDIDAGRLLQELRWTKNVLAKNEPKAEVPASRAFYWSKIESAISRGATAKSAPSPDRLAFFLLWKRWVTPVAALTAAVITVLAFVKFLDFGSSLLHPASVASVESPSEAMGAYSFRSQKEKVFVIWLYDRNIDTRADLAFVNDLVIQ